MLGVVLIEDAPVARDYLAATLNADPDILVLESSADVAHALGILASERTSAVVVGYHPPHTNGLDIAAQVRAVREVPVILIYQGWAETDDALTALAERAQRVGVIGVLRGPLGMGSAAQASFHRGLRAAVKQAAPAMVA
ncbi:MAG: hypothetical protein A3K19_32880 [Lentisphaerae bacterium RIFOXYB12_FULL_65_16]|nr:MAG: hypothetical protein A3K18_21090 [Lentisphaerae bacterium RIFOXYA12_64_32]OGV93510.1 MAG: hypothetical protein A3K19_32880 [Lentisphaerae bacterium RIFOXYB12_FULL_65_16]